MSFAAIAVGVGSGVATLAGSAIQAGASDDAAGALQQGAQQNLHLYNQQKPINDQLLQQGQYQNDGLLQQQQYINDGLYQDAYGKSDQYYQDLQRRGDRLYSPYVRLGRQGNNRLSRYLGAVPTYLQRPKAPHYEPGRLTLDQRLAKWKADYGRPGGPGDPQNQQPPEPPAGLKGPALAQWQAKNKDKVGTKSTYDADYKAARAGFMKDIAGEDKAHKAALAQYKTKLTAWQKGSKDFARDQRGKDDFGDYFKPFTKDDLLRDPVYQTEIDEGIRAWDQGAASRGSLMSGNTVAGLRDVTADAINRGYNRDWQSRDRKYNALLGLSAMGQNVADKRLNLMSNVTNNRSNLINNSAQLRASQLNNTALNRVNNNQWGTGHRLQNNQWATGGAAGANTQAADAAASGHLNRGAAWGNAFNNIGQMGMLHGMGAFDSKPQGYGGTGGMLSYGDYLRNRKILGY